MSLIPFLGRRKLKISRSLLEFVELDAALSESHNYTAQITTNPVEQGANVANHMRILPKTFKISGIVSNHPLALTQISLNPQRAEDALGTLLLWQGDAETLTLTTTLTSYDDIALVITSIGVTRDKERGNVVALDLTLEEVVFASSAFAAVEPQTAVEGAKPAKTKGKVSTKQKPKPKSLLLKGLGG